jgi:hypothetical protein
MSWRKRRARCRIARQYAIDYLADPANRTKDAEAMANELAQEMEDDLGEPAGNWLAILLPIIKMLLELWLDDDD